ncbi:DUF1993 domain-containing protein [Erythrobacter donghaensis]|jgi:hypothetical protein|uniref:DUF1993 domain-containing protein n=1 Tax=Erythrobacter donghaensis TaxID=267135 RepID=UPI00093AE470|nr:DUF1993 domain-containing protein [Erythrobacter donghaensis]
MAIATPALMRAVFTHHLERLDALLAIAAEQAPDDEAILAARLHPDMHPLVRQVQIACDIAKNAAARLTATPAPSFADDEDSIAALRRRIADTLAFLATIEEEAWAGAESRRVAFAFGGRPVEAGGEDYLLGFAVPNCLFHTAITYAILRNLGIPLGKRDFLGSPQGLEGL